MYLLPILGAALIIYAVFVYKLSGIIKRKYLYETTTEPVINIPKWTLTNLVKRLLDIFLVFLFVIIIIWPIVLVVMGVSQNATPTTWGVDIAAFTGFKLDVNAIAGIETFGLRNPEIHGQSLMNFDTSSKYGWYLFLTTQLLSTIVALFVVVQLRAMVMSLQNGLSFSDDNALRIKRLGIVAIAWNVVMPFVQYFGWGAFIKEISFNTEGIQFYPAFELSAIGIVGGILLIILSGILTEAAQVSREQELTI